MKNNITCSNLPEVDFVLSVASWEERFLLGNESIIEKITPKAYLVSYCEDYAQTTLKNREAIEKCCRTRNIAFHDNPLSFLDPLKSWMAIKDFQEQRLEKKSDVLLDISTMPRESIWTMLYFLEKLECNIHYVYNKPKKYNDEWLSRDPDKPRLVFKLGGVYKHGCGSVLIVLSGADVDRINQLVSFFEPKITMLGVQDGDEAHYKYKYIEKNVSNFKKDVDTNIFTIDAFSCDHGYSKIESVVEKYYDTHNLILSSLGPKLSAIALYKLQKKYPDVALAYAPSKQFNQEYSFGIGQRYIGHI